MRGVIILLLLSRIAFGQDINEVRQLYLEAGKERQNTVYFVDYFSNSKKGQNVLFLAYQGTALTMKADLEKGKINKYRVFVEGRDILESAIKTNRENVEIRYLRFAVQLNIPRILGYNHLDEDKNFLLENINEIQMINNKELQEVIYSTLLTYRDISESEKLLVKSKSNQNN